MPVVEVGVRAWAGGARAEDSGGSSSAANRRLQNEARKRDRVKNLGIGAGVRSDGRTDVTGSGGGVVVDGRRGGTGRSLPSSYDNQPQQQKQPRRTLSEALVESIGGTAHQYVALWEILERVYDADPFPAVAKAAAAVVGVVLDEVDALASVQAVQAGAAVAMAEAGAPVKSEGSGGRPMVQGSTCSPPR